MTITTPLHGAVERFEAPSLLAEQRRLAERFASAASAYDFLTSRASPGYDRHLTMSASRLDVGGEDGLGRGRRILDLCAGTGLSTEALVRTYPAADIVALDLSREMLARARGKSSLARVRFVEGDATDPARAGVEGPFDAILMAYGIRNIPDPDRCLANVLALLVPGGTACFHEYSVRDSRVASAVFDAVARLVIEPLGTVTTGSPALYRYLRRSVRGFDGVDAFERRLLRAGFRHVHTEPMDGWLRGIVHSFLGSSPR